MREVYSDKKASSVFFEMGGEASPVFKAVETTFDAVALFVELGVMGDWAFAVSLGGDYRLGPI